MRIVSGKFKGRRIKAPKNLPVRPTTDMAKESLFNIINNEYYFDKLTVLDLFSGTGNIAIEFASRGAPQITAVDKHSACIKQINDLNREFDTDIATYRMDVFKYLDQAATKYKLIFADPPYDFSQELFESIVQKVFDNNLLLEEGLLVVEHSKHTELNHLKHFQYDKRYGGNVFSFFSYDE